MGEQSSVNGRGYVTGVASRKPLQTGKQSSVTRHREKSVGKCKRETGVSRKMDYMRGKEPEVRADR